MNAEMANGYFRDARNPAIIMPAQALAAHMPATIQRLGENLANSKTRMAKISPAKAPRNLAQYGVPDFFIVIFSKASFAIKLR